MPRKSVMSKTSNNDEIQQGHVSEKIRNIENLSPQKTSSQSIIAAESGITSPTENNVKDPPIEDTTPRKSINENVNTTKISEPGVNTAKSSRNSIAQVNTKNDENITPPSKFNDQNVSTTKSSHQNVSTTKSSHQDENTTKSIVSRPSIYDDTQNVPIDKSTQSIISYQAVNTTTSRPSFYHSTREEASQTPRNKNSDNERFYPEPNPFELFSNPWSNPFQMSCFPPCGFPQCPSQIMNSMIPYSEYMNGSVYCSPGIQNPPCFVQQPCISGPPPLITSSSMPSYPIWPQSYCYPQIPPPQESGNVDGFLSPLPYGNLPPALLPPLPLPSTDCHKKKSKSKSKLKKKRSKIKDEDEDNEDIEKWTCWSHPKLRKKKWWLVWDKSQEWEKKRRKFEDPFSNFGKRDKCCVEGDVVYCDSYTDDFIQADRDQPQRPLGHMTSIKSKPQSDLHLDKCTQENSDQHYQPVQCHCQCRQYLQCPYSPGGVRTCHTCHCSCRRPDKPHCQMEKTEHKCPKLVCDRDGVDDITEVDATLVRSIKISCKNKRKNRCPKNMTFNVDLASVKMLSSLLTTNTDCSSAKQLCDRITRGITSPTYFPPGRQTSSAKQDIKCVRGRTIECEGKQPTCSNPCASIKNQKNTYITSPTGASTCEPKQDRENPFPARPRHLDHLLRCFDQDLCQLPCHGDVDCIKCCSSSSKSNSSPENEHERSSQNSDIDNCDSTTGMVQEDPCKKKEHQKERDSCKPDNPHTRKYRPCERCCKCCKNNLCCKSKKCTCRSIKTKCVCWSSCQNVKSKAGKCHPKCHKQLNVCYDNTDQTRGCPKKAPSSLHIVSRGPYSSVNVHYSEHANAMQKCPVWSSPIPPCVHQENQTRYCKDDCTQEDDCTDPPSKYETKEIEMLCTKESLPCITKPTDLKFADSSNDSKTYNKCYRKEDKGKGPCPVDGTKNKNVCLKRQPQCYSKKTESCPCTDQELDVDEAVEKKNCDVDPEKNIELKQQKKCIRKKKKPPDTPCSGSKDVKILDIEPEKRSTFGPCNEDGVWGKNLSSKKKDDEHLTEKDTNCEDPNTSESKVKKGYGPCGKNNVSERRERTCESFDSFEPRLEKKNCSRFSPCDENGICESKSSPQRKYEKYPTERKGPCKVLVTDEPPTDNEKYNSPCYENGVCEFGKKPQKNNEKYPKENDDAPCEVYDVFESESTKLKDSGGPCDENGVCELRKSPQKDNEKYSKQNEGPCKVHDLLELESTKMKSSNFGSAWDDSNSSDSNSGLPEKKEKNPKVQNERQEIITKDKNPSEIQDLESDNSFALSDETDEEHQNYGYDSNIEKSDTQIEPFRDTTDESDPEICYSQSSRSSKDAPFQDRPCFEDHSHETSGRQHSTLCQELAYNGDIKTKEQNTDFSRSKQKSQSKSMENRREFHNSLKSKKTQEQRHVNGTRKEIINNKNLHVKNSETCLERPCFEDHSKNRRKIEHKTSKVKNLDNVEKEDHGKLSRVYEIQRIKTKTLTRKDGSSQNIENNFGYDDYYTNDKWNDMPCFHNHGKITGNKYQKIWDSPCFHNNFNIQSKEENAGPLNRNFESQSPCVHEDRTIKTKEEAVESAIKFRNRNAENPNPCFQEKSTIKTEVSAQGIASNKSRKTDNPSPCFHRDFYTIKTEDEEVESFLGDKDKKQASQENVYFPYDEYHIHDRSIKKKKMPCFHEENSQVENRYHKKGESFCFHKDRSTHSMKDNTRTGSRQTHFESHEDFHVITESEQVQRCPEDNEKRPDSKENDIYFPNDEHHIHDESITMKERPCFHEESSNIINAYHMIPESPCFHKDRSIHSKEGMTRIENTETDNRRPCFHQHLTMISKEEKLDGDVEARNRGVPEVSSSFSSKKQRDIKAKQENIESKAAGVSGSKIYSDSPCFHEIRKIGVTNNMERSSKRHQISSNYQSRSGSSQNSKTDKSSSDIDLIPTGSDTDYVKKCASRNSFNATVTKGGSKRYRKYPNSHRSRSIDIGKEGQIKTENFTQPRHCKIGSRGPCSHKSPSRSNHKIQHFDSNSELKQQSNSRDVNQSPSVFKLQSVNSQKLKTEDSYSDGYKDLQSIEKESPCSHHHWSDRSHSSISDKSETRRCKNSYSKMDKQKSCFLRCRSMSSCSTKLERNKTHTNLKNETTYSHEHGPVARNIGKTIEVKSDHSQKPKRSKTDRHSLCSHDDRIIKSQEDKKKDEVSNEDVKTLKNISTGKHIAGYKTDTFSRSDSTKANKSHLESHLATSFSPVSSIKSTKTIRSQEHSSSSRLVNTSDSTNSATGPHIHEAPSVSSPKIARKDNFAKNGANIKTTEDTRKLCSKNPCFHYFTHSMNNDTNTKANDKGQGRISSPQTKRVKDSSSPTSSNDKNKESELCKRTGRSKCNKPSSENSKKVKKVNEMTVGKMIEKSASRPDILEKHQCNNLSKIESQCDNLCPISFVSKLQNEPHVCTRDSGLEAQEQKERVSQNTSSRCRESKNVNDQKNEIFPQWTSLYSGDLTVSEQRNPSQLVSENIPDTSSDIGTYECLPDDTSSTTNEKVQDEEKQIRNENPDHCLNQSMSNRSSSVCNGICEACKRKSCSGPTNKLRQSQCFTTKECDGTRAKCDYGRYHAPKEWWCGKRKVNEKLCTVVENDVRPHSKPEHFWGSESRKICETLYSFENSPKWKNYRNIPKHKENCEKRNKDLCERTCFCRLEAKQDDTHGKTESFRLIKKMRSPKDNSHSPKRFWEQRGRLQFYQKLAANEQSKNKRERKLKIENVNATSSNKFSSLKRSQSHKKCTCMKKSELSVKGCKSRKKRDQEPILNVILIQMPKTGPPSNAKNKPHNMLKYETVDTRYQSQISNKALGDIEGEKAAKATSSDSCNSKLEKNRHSLNCLGNEKNRKIRREFNTNVVFAREHKVPCVKRNKKKFKDVLSVSDSSEELCNKSSAYLQTLPHCPSECKTFPETKLKRCNSPGASDVSLSSQKVSKSKKQGSELKKAKAILRHNKKISSPSSPSDTSKISNKAKLSKKQTSSRKCSNRSSSSSDSNLCVLKRRDIQDAKLREYSKSRSSSKRSSETRVVSESKSEGSTSNRSSSSNKSSSSASEIPKSREKNKIGKKCPACNNISKKSNDTDLKNKLSQQRQKLLQIDSSIDHEIVKALCTVYEKCMDVDMSNLSRTALNYFNKDHFCHLAPQISSRNFTLKQNLIKDGLKKDYCQKAKWKKPTTMTSHRSSFQIHSRSLSTPSHTGRRSNGEIATKPGISSWKYRCREAIEDVSNKCGNFPIKKFTGLSGDADVAVPKSFSPPSANRSSFMYTSTCKMNNGTTIETTYCSKNTKSSARYLRLSSLTSKSRRGLDRTRPFSGADDTKDFSCSFKDPQFRQLKCLPLMPASLSLRFFQGDHKKYERREELMEPAPAFGPLLNSTDIITKDVVQTNTQIRDETETSKKKMQNSLPQPDVEGSRSNKAKVTQSYETSQQQSYSPTPIRKAGKNSPESEENLLNQYIPTNINTVKPICSDESQNEQCEKSRDYSEEKNISTTQELSAKIKNQPITALTIPSRKQENCVNVKPSTSQIIRRSNRTDNFIKVKVPKTEENTVGDCQHETSDTLDYWSQYDKDI